jgi:kumamolisin
MNYVTLVKRRPEALESTTALDATDLARPFEVLVEFRRKAELPTGGGPISKEELCKLYGAREDDIEAVKKIATDHGLEVTDECPGKRLLKVRGRLENVLKVFHGEIGKAAGPDGKMEFRSAGLEIPEELDKRVVAVHGLHTGPPLEPHLAALATTTEQPFLPITIADNYRFRRGTGKGATVALLEFGGGFEIEDLRKSREMNGIESSIEPKVVRINAENTAGTTTHHREVALDLQVVSALAPEAEIVVYLSARGDKERIETISKAVHADPTPTVISMSWGLDERRWDKATLKSFGRYLEEAAVLGIVFLASSGDFGSGLGAMATDYPASAPCVVSCGGTQMDPAGALDQVEVVWDDHGSHASGGGFSKIYRRPAYQDGLERSLGHGRRQRGIPDVAGYACLNPGYSIVLGGEEVASGGTSAVAPLYAGFIAGIAGDRLLYRLNNILYGLGTGFRDIERGSNDRRTQHGGFQAMAGWDACTGLGRAEGDVIAPLLEQRLVERP